MIKDLTRLTGFTPARIRKWQERHGILRPVQASNGYHYYSDEDYQVLVHLRARLEAGDRLQDILAGGRDDLLTREMTVTPENARRLSLIAAGRLSELEKELDSSRKRSALQEWITGEVHPLVVLVGEAWEAGRISVADEHVFSHWIIGCLWRAADALGIRPARNPGYLVAVFPGDPHELGALMHYLLTSHAGTSARFVGMLPEEELLIEVGSRRYDTVGVSVVLPQSEGKRRRLTQKIRERYPSVRVQFGGVGVEGRKGRGELSSK